MSSVVDPGKTGTKKGVRRIGVPAELQKKGGSRIGALSKRAINREKEGTLFRDAFDPIF